VLALVQRVTSASVAVEGESVGAIDRGLVAFVGIQRDDTRARAEALLKKLLGYRIFADDQGKMNLNLAQVGGGALVVSQFTLAADTRKGLRPSFSSAAPPDLAEQLYNHFVRRLSAEHGPVATGAFAANMQVSLVNDGPVTFMLAS